MKAPSEEIGIWWLGEEIKTPGGRKIKGKIWWGVCKKTRKVAFATLCDNTIHAMAPMIIQTTEIVGDECLDGTFCLNLDCPYATSSRLIDAINTTSWKGVNSDENLENYFTRMFQEIDKYFEQQSDQELDEHFKEHYQGTTVSDPAFETRMKK